MTENIEKIKHMKKIKICKIYVYKKQMLNLKT